jgi:hypothetical protein
VIAANHSRQKMEQRAGDKFRQIARAKSQFKGWQRSQVSNTLKALVLINKMISVG